ncbi:TonB-dependent receptor [Flagellimonas taeanensis]|uniref:TonB-dependent receptor n=1 Tax=Flavobacteriaceae TaxID=49546 RepID=UPI000E6895B6|nr:MULTISPECIES: TonB-dependent receptor [Allomuricauda]MDC6385803.1 TonB-dependent receptor [Muricauda sp. SK9]RIV50920.1 TonB-dependent receptor [Allomuricauda taeanensis]
MKSILDNKHLLTGAFLFLAHVAVFAQSTGSFQGKIIEQVTKQPVMGASVAIDNTELGAITDDNGVFKVDDIPVGTYAVTISYIGFQTKKISEMTITANKTYYSEYELLEEVSELDGVTVSVYKGETNPQVPVSAFSYSREEIFRNPGAQGDIMRALSSLPGVVSSGSQFSAIAARGQGTRDNVYMVDDIPMFNLSHLEAEGFNSGFNDPNGGRFSIFAPRIIDNVQFQNGGFGATYGRRSSSFLSLGVKEGNRASWSVSGQFDLLGATLIADGPISEKTSVFVSARYQNFGMLIDLLDEQQASISFGDYLVKTTTQLNEKNKLSVIAMINPESASRTIDDLEPGMEINEDNSGRTVLWDHERSQAVVGLNLRTLLNSSSYLTNVLYYRSSSVDNNFGRFNPSLDDEGVIVDPLAGGYEERIRTILNDQQEVGYRSIYTKNFDKLTLTAGVDAAMVDLDYERRLSRMDTLYTFRTRDISDNPSQLYEVLDPSLFNSRFDDNAFNGSGYINASWKVSNRFTLNPGVRYDYTGFTEQHTLSPRLSGSFALSEKHSLNFATGLYYQDAAYPDVAGQSDGNLLKNERSFQSILGYKIQISSDLKFIAEGWYKEFDDLIVQPNRAQSFLTNDGTGHAYGADISLTKRLSKNYYGQISYSYMESVRDDNDGLGEYDYIFSVPHTFSFLGSYKPNDKWIFSGKFRYSTGRPTDEYIIHEDVFNDPEMLRYSQEITAINGDRLADFISLDLRVDYNVLRSWGTFSAFVDLVNITNRFNVNMETFIPETGVISNIGLGVFPTFGIRVEL